MLWSSWRTSTHALRMMPRVAMVVEAGGLVALVQAFCSECAEDHALACLGRLASPRRTVPSTSTWWTL